MSENKQIIVQYKTVSTIDETENNVMKIFAGFQWSMT